MAKADLTAQHLREIFHYDPATGILTTTAKLYKRAVGTQVGFAHNKGYVTLRLYGERYLAHRLIWLMVTGSWPKHGIDHINGIKSDNRFENLRDVPQTTNMQNLKKSVGKSASGLLGVAWASRSKKWQAQISANGRHYHLGYHQTKEEAHAAYLSAKAVLHSHCPSLSFEKASS